MEMSPFPNVTLVSLPLPLKAKGSMAVTVFGIVTDSSSLQLPNARFPILTTE